MNSAFGSALRQLSGPVLLTGHTGFKGTWLTLLLEHLEIPVIGYALPAEKDSLFDRAKRIGSIPETFSDIRDLDSLRRFIQLHHPATVIHLAAQPLVLESYKTPVETFATNVLGTANVLSVSFEAKTIQTIAVITTDKVYRNDNSGRAFIESDPLAGKDPYSASKVGTEAAISAWQQIAKVSGGPSVVSLRAGNVVGGGDWAQDRLIPDLIRGFMNGGKITLRNPQSTRPWQHVLDPLIGYLMAVEYSLKGNQVTAFNFGPSTKSLQVQRVAEIAQGAWPAPTEIETSLPSMTSVAEAVALDLDSQKAHSELSWTPVWSQEAAVVSTVKWWDQVLSKDVDPQLACVEDIEFALKYSSLGNP